MKNELLEKLSQLQEKFEKLKNSLNLDEKSTELKILQSQMEAPRFWDDQKKAKKNSQKAAQIEQFIKKWEEIASNLKDLPELIEMANEKECSEIGKEVQNLEEDFQKGETELLLSGKFDAGNVILSIHVGTGGQDAEDFCSMLLRMYLRFCEQKNYTTKMIDESPSDDGLKSATIEISGPMAYGFLKAENGVHRLIRLSPFNAKNLRQTSFAKVEVLPEIEDDTEVQIEEKDLRIDVFRASGHGGQSVNTTDSAVRITYLPLNLVVTCQNEKSQLQNKAAAMKVLKSRLLKLKQEQNAQKIDELRGDKMEADFGSQIRTYTLQPYKLVKDHRTDYEENNPDKVFDGNLDGFIDSYLRNSK